MGDTTGDVHHANGVHPVPLSPRSHRSRPSVGFHDDVRSVETQPEDNNEKDDNPLEPTPTGHKRIQKTPTFHRRSTSINLDNYFVSVRDLCSKMYTDSMTHSLVRLIPLVIHGFPC